MFFAGGGSGDAERCVFAGYGGERAVRYAGIRKGSGGVLCRNTEKNGRCFMREYEGERAVRYEGIRKGSGGEEIAAWRQVRSDGEIVGGGGSAGCGRRVSGLWATGQRLVRME